MDHPAGRCNTKRHWRRYAVKRLIAYRGIPNLWDRIFLPHLVISSFTFLNIAAVGSATPPNSSTMLPRPLWAQTALGRMRSGESARGDCDADAPLPPPSLLPSSPSHHPSSRPRHGHGFLTWKLILHDNGEMKMRSSCKSPGVH